MRTSATICLLIAVAMIADLAVAHSTSAQNEWRQFKRQFGKSYATRAEETRRFANFLASRETIARHNEAGKSSHKLGLNHMSDWSDEEFGRINGLKYDAQTVESVRLTNLSEVYSLLALDNGPIPYELDWRQVAGRVSPVKDQGKCASDWAFATIGMLEGQEATRNVSSGGEIELLSEQELVDCAHTNSGCDGGNMASALDDIKSLGGVETNEDYPYKASRGECKFEKSKVAMSVAGSTLLPANEQLLKRALAKYGPIAVAIEATQQFKFYERGVFFDDSCVFKNLNHGLLLVGYGNDPDEGEYWLLKNSWSEKWGEKGYVRFKRGSNMCGIADMATMAKF